MMCIDRLPLMGSTANTNTRMPMPPIQCVNSRQNIPPRVMLSGDVTTLAPVVVRPEIVSNRASM